MSVSENKLIIPPARARWHTQNTPTAHARSRAHTLSYELYCAQERADCTKQNTILLDFELQPQDLVDDPLETENVYEKYMRVCETFCVYFCMRLRV